MLTCKDCKFYKKQCPPKYYKKYLKKGKVCKKYAGKLDGCLTCLFYSECKDKNKSVNYICTKFKNIRFYDKYDLSKFTNDIEIITKPKQVKTDKEIDLSKLDLSEYVDKIINSDFKEIPDIIDDTDFPKAPNFMEFAIGKQFLDEKPFPKQLEIGLKLFMDICPKCSNPKWFKSIPKDATYGEILDNIVLLKHGVCPKCKRNRYELYKDNLYPAYYDELAVNAGQRSGKSYLVAMLSNYIIHRYITYTINPARFLGLSKASILHGTFVALTFQQVVDNLWEPFMRMNLNSQWFKEYYDFIAYKSEKLGEEIVKVREHSISLRHKNLVLYPASPDIRILRGRTRFLAGIDELGWFDNSPESKKVKLNANEVYIALERSLRTVRSSAKKKFESGNYDTPSAYFLNISSPSHQKDKIMELVKKSNKVKRILAFHLATWEMNPTISRKDLDDEFRVDPIKAERDYGANPPLTLSPFIPTLKYIKPMIAKKERNAIKLKLKKHRNKAGVITVYGKPIFKTKSNIPHLLSIDAGYSNNQFALTLHRLEIDEEDIIRKTEAMMVIPPMDEYPINFSLVYSNIIKPIIKNFNVKVVASDRWQSIKILHDIEQDFGIKTIQYSLIYDDFITLKNDMFEGKLTIPKPELKRDKILSEAIDWDIVELSKYPIAYFIIQALTVQDTGRQVVKGDGFDDDIWRAFSLGNTMLLDEDIQEELLKFDYSNERENRSNRGFVMASLDNRVIRKDIPNSNIISSTRAGVLAKK